MGTANVIATEGETLEAIPKAVPNVPAKAVSIGTAPPIHAKNGN